MNENGDIKVMEFRTKINIEPASFRISYSDKVMLLGSCFATSVGSKMMMGNIPVMMNPTGTIYNPVSVSNALDIILTGKEYTSDDLYCYRGNYINFNYYTDFSSTDPDTLVKNLNFKSGEAFNFMQEADHLFITFGTARVYRFVETGQIVSNCHKLPDSFFKRELLQVQDIVTLWNKQLDRLHSLFPSLKIIFTISPVRHWKDGAHGNQVSKSVLFLAIEELLNHKISPSYFPAYELVMDDLRDYRYYADDMLHPSETAVNYIWEAFSESYFEKAVRDIWEDVVRIKKAVSHRIKNGTDSESSVFASKMLEKIALVEKKEPLLDLARERSYFITLLEKKKSDNL